MAFCALGLVIGSWTSGRSAPAIGNLVLLPMIHIPGVLIPRPASLPRSDKVAPAYHLDQLALGALGGSLRSGVLTHVMVFAAITGLFLGLSIWRFFLHHD